MHEAQAPVSAAPTTVVSVATEGVNPVATERRVHPRLCQLIEAHATGEGTTASSLLDGLHFYRVSAPTHFRKTRTYGPTLVVAAQGQKLAKLAGGELLYGENHYLVVTADVHLEGVVLEASRERPYLALCLTIPPEVVAKTLLALVDANARPDEEESLPAFVSPVDSAMQSCVVRLLESLADPLDRKLLAPLVVEELIFRLLRCEAARVVRSAVRESDAPIRTAMQFMRANATRPLSVEQIARHAGMSKSHFAHRFSAVARVSPMRFLKRLRLEAGRELMLGEGLGAAEAARRVGYESPSHFTRDFKHAYGRAPAEYVRRIRSG